jgi:hypothetical protein
MCEGVTTNVFQPTIIDVASNPSNPYSTALILSGYNSSDFWSSQQLGKCELQARWPANYGDVYFGVDGCLYDSGSSKIFDQCCSIPETNGLTVNPYLDPRPAASCQRQNTQFVAEFKIYSKGWITDNGDDLYRQAEGCKDMSEWDFGTNDSIEIDGSSAGIGKYKAQYLAKFNHVPTFNSECVERAIASAGGPEGVQCNLTSASAPLDRVVPT